MDEESEKPPSQGINGTDNLHSNTRIIPSSSSQDGQLLGYGEEYRGLAVFCSLRTPNLLRCRTLLANLFKE